MTAAGGDTPRAFFRPREPRRRQRGPWLGVLAALLVLGYVIVFGESGWLPLRAERAEVEALRAETQALEAAVEELRARREAFERPGSLELERHAREVHRMHGPDEEVLHLLDTPTPPEDSGS